jgi:hypothetical protein
MRVGEGQGPGNGAMDGLRHQHNGESRWSTATPQSCRHRASPRPYREEYLRDLFRVLGHWPRNRYIELCAVMLWDESQRSGHAPLSAS